LSHSCSQAESEGEREAERRYRSTAMISAETAAAMSDARRGTDLVTNACQKTAWSSS